MAAALLAAGCGTSIDVAVEADDAESTAAADPTPPPTEPASAPEVAEPDLAVGDCFTATELQFVDGLPVSCERPHVAEFFAVILRTDPPGAEWPGLEAIQDDASDYCNSAFGEIMGVAGELAALDILFFRPDARSWAGGDREVACFVEYPEEVSESLVAIDPLRSFGLVSTFALRPGDCVADASLTETVAVTLVSCDSAHAFEVFHSAMLEEQPFPDRAAMSAIVDAACGSAFASFVGVAFSQSELEIEQLFPSRESWELWDDRLISCAITAAEPRTESAEGSGI